MSNGHRKPYKPMTAQEVHSALLGLTESGEIMPVWDAEQNDVAFWSVNEAPPNVEPLTTDQVREHFAKVEELLKQ